MPKILAFSGSIRRESWNRKPYLGGSDANALNALGIPCVNLGIGAQNPHANDEFILLEDFDATARVARELIRRSVHLR